jgi:flagellar protein FlaG
MRIDALTSAPTPATIPSQNTAQDSTGIQSQNRQVIQAARTVNASDSLGQNELTFSLDPRSHRAIIKIVNRETQEVVEQIPSEVVLRLAESLKTTE